MILRILMFLVKRDPQILPLNFAHGSFEVFVAVPADKRKAKTGLGAPYF